MNQESDGPLSSCRVLDLTDEKGLFCGKMLADLGADVIKIEPPGGDPCRNMGPFYHDIPDPEKSLYWLSFNTGKRGITLILRFRTGERSSSNWSRRLISLSSPMPRAIWIPSALVTQP